MNTIPIIFAIDNNVVMQCGVTITSLLLNAKLDTYYDIYILCNQAQLDEDNCTALLNAFADNMQSHLTFVDVGDAYSDAAPMRRITTPTFYRLMIPTLFPQFDKVIYADIDIIFQQDLFELYQASLQNGELVAAARDLAIDDKLFFKSELPYTVGKSEKDYFNAGFLVMNLKQMQAENIVEEFNRHAKIKYEQNDQDILNIVCKDRVKLLPSLYNFQPNYFSNYMWGREEAGISFEELFKKATLHYTGKYKPWNSLECTSCDTWWHYYKMSPFYDDMVYFKRQYDQIEASRNDYHNAKAKKILIQLMGRLKKTLKK